MRNKAGTGHMPLGLVLLFLGNVILTVLVQILLFYPCPAKPEAAQLGQLEPAWEGSRILSSDGTSRLFACVAETGEGERMLIVLNAHPVIIGRGKLVLTEPLDPHVTAEQVFHVRNGIRTSELVVTRGDTVSVRYAGEGSFRDAAAGYLLLGSVLTGIELLLIHMIRRHF